MGYPVALCGFSRGSTVSIAMSLDNKPPQEQDLSAGPGECTITLADVSQHGEPNDCWVIVFDRVYNLTDFITNHPGGSEVLLEHAGCDATFAFQEAGHGRDMLEVLEAFYVGALPLSECIFNKGKLCAAGNNPLLSPS